MSSNAGCKSVIRAFFAGNSKRLKNDSTDGENLYYHGNRIAWMDKGNLYFSLCGWDTLTTRTRLNLVLPSNYRLRRVKGETVLSVGDKQHEISTRLPYAVTDFH